VAGLTPADRARLAALLTGQREGEAPVAHSQPHTGSVDDAADGNLAAVVAAWPNLPEPIRAGILAMVRASQIPASFPALKNNDRRGG
jgi:hypothetical protein